MQEPAPIIKAVDRVAEDLRAFVYDPQAKAMLWEVTDDSAKIVEMTLTLHMESEAFVPALVLPFEAAFDDAVAYEARLCEELDAMLADDDPFGETPISLPDFEDDAPFGDRMAMLAQATAECMKALIIFYAPEGISDSTAFTTWLAAQIDAQQGSQLRTLVVDEPGGPVGAALMAVLGPQMMSCRPDVSMNGLMRDTLAQTPPPTNPAEQIGKILPQAVIAMREGKNADARENCFEARELARKNGLKTLEMTAGILLANGWFADQDYAETRKAAQETAARHALDDHDAQDLDHRVQADLRMQALMLSGTTRIAEEDYGEGVPDFEAAAETAALLENHLQHFEGLRLAAWCHGKEDARADMWRCAEAALLVAQDLPEMFRESGSLPFLLIDLDDALTRQAHRDQLDDHATALLGPDWRESAKEAVESASGGEADG